MVKGYMASCGITAGDKRIGKALSIVFPLYQVQRNANTARQINPYPYHADYFGHKLHMDQNEKLAMYGLTEVSAYGGYSGKIVAFATMPVKNNVLIYDNVYRTAVIQHCIWDQLRVDHGTEFYLSLYVQEKMSPNRTNTRRAPFIRTTSKQNHPAKRKWVEFNSRVNYPVKRALNAMVNEDLINMDDDMNKFCVSWFTSRVADIGIKQVISSWNNQAISGKGVPDKRMEEINKTFILPSIDMVPTGEEAVSAYERDGGNLRSPEVFGTDILAGNQQLQQLRFDNFNAAYPCFEVIFYCLVNGDHHPFREGLMNFIDLTTAYNPN